MNQQHQRVKSLLRIGGMLAAGALLASCAQDAPQDTFRPAGEYSQSIDDVVRPVFYTAAVVGTIVMTVVAFILIRYRDRGQPIPEQSHGNKLLEYIFIVIPALILFFIAIPTVRTVFSLNDTAEPDCVVNVTGQQWWWEFDYPVAEDGTLCGFAPEGEAEPIITSGQMVIPTGTKVVIRGTSRDVIHSFWVPRLNGKRDMVPGRMHTWNFNADKPGIYSGQCAEFCGLSHAAMRMEIVALDADDFQTWLNRQLTPPAKPEEGSMAAAGESQFIAQCSRCHQVDGLEDASGNLIVSRPQDSVYSGSAPNLTHLMSRNTFAGAAFQLLNEACYDKVWDASPEEFGELYLEGVNADCLNETQLKQWLRNAPQMKPMYTDGELLEPTDGKTRGMPDLGLSEDQISEIVAYLETLK